MLYKRYNKQDKIEINKYINASVIDAIQFNINPALVGLFERDNDGMKSFV